MGFHKPLIRPAISWGGVRGYLRGVGCPIHGIHQVATVESAKTLRGGPKAME